MDLKKFIYLIAVIITAMVWFINGLICKVLHLVPRHQEIVARILGNNHSVTITRIIGVLEILMAVWMLSGIRRRWCAGLQIMLVVSMNIIEFILAPDLLLFGRMNILFALLFVLFICWTEWGWPNKHSPKST